MGALYACAEGIRLCNLSWKKEIIGHVNHITLIIQKGEKL